MLPLKAVTHSLKVFKTLLLDYRYFASVQGHALTDKDGYIPWFTFPAIEALKNWNLSARRVFEYGSGYSTLFWAANTAQVISVEHNPEWHERISSLLPVNARIILAPITQGDNEHEPLPQTRSQFARYAESIKDQNDLFDIIVIDGYSRSRVRHQCAQVSLPHLSHHGMMIVDNSDWLPATCLYLRRAGLIQIDFSGFVPGNPHTQTTSFFLTAKFNFEHRQKIIPVGGTGYNWERALESQLLGNKGH